MVADWSMGLLSDPVSPVVAANSFRCGVFLLGLATAPEKGKFKIAHYQKLRLARLQLNTDILLAFRESILSNRIYPVTAT